MSDTYECIVQEISMDRNSPEPLFTVICEEKCDYRVFWLSEFVEQVFTWDQYFEVMTCGRKTDR